MEYFDVYVTNSVMLYCITFLNSDIFYYIEKMKMAYRILENTFIYYVITDTVWP